MPVKSSTPSITTSSIKTRDGVVDAEDARRLFPQGHGDAYGHYLTALKGYYSLLLEHQLRLGAAHRSRDRPGQAGLGGLPG